MGKTRHRTIKIQIVSGVPTVFTVLIRVQAQNANVVPTTVPNTVPSWIYDDSAQLSGAYAGNGHISKYTISLGFKPGTTQAQMQAAVDSVRGKVIGGFPPIERYILQVPADNTGALVQAAATKLQSFPQVSFAEQKQTGGVVPHYRRPDDGGAWAKASWFASRDSARLAVWALEAINAPMAWGCDTGSASVKVAVVDRGFYSVSDLKVDPNSQNELNIDPDTIVQGLAHGTRVASLLTATGNNGATTPGMTGVMWTSDLLLYDWGESNAPGQALGQTDPDLTTSDIMLAAIAFADVVNISAGLGWDSVKMNGRMFGTGTPTQIATDVKQIRYWALSLKDVLDRMNSNPHVSHPLLVFSAGDHKIDARWSGWPAINDPAFFPTKPYYWQVIVVGGTNRAGQFWAATGHEGSGFGPLVDIVAPAESVYALDKSGIPQLGKGTSFSAPLVAGIAGLLKSHNPNISPANMKWAIVWGASQGGPDSLTSRWVMDPAGTPHFLADAYGALRQAAKIEQTALCGNQLFEEGDGSIWIVRGGADSIEWAGPQVANPFAWAMRVAHGGYDIMLNSDSTLHFDVNYGNWLVQGGVDTVRRFPNPPAHGIGPYITLYSHDRDSLLANAPPAPGSPGIFLYRQNGNTWIPSGLLWSPPSGVHSWGVLAFSPRGNLILGEKGCFGCDWTIFATYLGGGRSGSDDLLTLPNSYRLVSAGISEDGTEAALYSIWDPDNYQCEIQFVSLIDGRVSGPWFNLGTCIAGSLLNYPVAPDLIARTKGRTTSDDPVSAKRRIRTGRTEIPKPGHYSPSNEPRTLPPVPSGHPKGKQREGQSP